MNPFSHMDLRVSNLSENLPFYEALLPELGFTQTFHSQNWKVFACEGNLPSIAYFAITEDASHKPNENLIGFWAKDREEVDRLAQVVQEAGGKITSGPKLFPISPTYYAFYFEDPCGNQFEIVHRLN
jgi:predicted enzyme related to lactoylglutathione lyase